MLHLKVAKLGLLIEPRHTSSRRALPYPCLPLYPVPFAAPPHVEPYPTPTSMCVQSRSPPLTCRFECVRRHPKVTYFIVFLEYDIPTRRMPILEFFCDYDILIELLTNVTLQLLPNGAQTD
jgi:hypothetical protein